MSDHEHHSWTDLYENEKSMIEGVSGNSFTFPIPSNLAASDPLSESPSSCSTTFLSPDPSAGHILYESRFSLSLPPLPLFSILYNSIRCLWSPIWRLDLFYVRYVGHSYVSIRRLPIQSRNLFIHSWNVGLVFYCLSLLITMMVVMPQFDS